MQRRDFLKALTALVGASAITPAFAASLPEEITVSKLAIGYLVDGGFNEFAGVDVLEHFGANQKLIEFPEFVGKGRVVISHISYQGKLFPLRNKVTLSDGCVARFPVGALTITEE